MLNKKKVIQLLVEMMLYFIIVFIVFLLAQRIGFYKNASVIVGAIGSTIGWLIVKIYLFIKEAKKSK